MRSIAARAASAGAVAVCIAFLCVLFPSNTTHASIHTSPPPHAFTIMRDATTTSRPGWFQRDDTWYYVTDAGTLATGWLKWNNTWYYLDASGAMLSNTWLRHAGQWYYLNRSGAMATGWLQWDGEWYYLDSHYGGTMATGWRLISSKWYYLDPQHGGALAYGLFQAADNHYYFSSEASGGAIHQSQWVTSSGRRYWASSSGAVAQGWFNVSGQWYYGDPSKAGAVHTGWLLDNKKWYYLDPQRKAALTYGLFATPNGKYYISTESTGGAIYTNQWVSHLGNWYYANPDGSLHTGWLQDGGSWYYLTPAKKGAMTTGWLRLNNKWYYLDPNGGGRMHTGWLSVGAVRYYLQPDGEMVTGAVTVNGKLHYFDSTGAWRFDSKPVIDISQWQDPSKTNYDLLAKSISGAIIRIGYTGTATGNSYYKDKHFEKHYRELTKRNIPVGVYWYSAANSGNEGTAEARKALEYLGTKKLQYPIYMDVEDPTHQAHQSRATLTNQITQFVKTVKSKGHSAGVYASASWFESKFNKPELDKLNISYWVAHWNAARPSINGSWDLWQYTVAPGISGYNGRIDLNITPAL